MVINRGDTFRVCSEIPFVGLQGYAYKGEGRRIIFFVLSFERRYKMGRKKNIDQDTIEYAWWSLWLLGGHKYRGD
jgi:hypothetical protein